MAKAIVFSPAVRRAMSLTTAALLLIVGFGTQLRFLRTFPQPMLFGDPLAYDSTGKRFLEALARVVDGESIGAAFESIRGLLYFLGAGGIFAVLEALRPGDLPFFRLVFAVSNTLSMLGVFLLARRLSGSSSGGLAALALASIYPSFSLQVGRLFPDPVTGCLFVVAAWLYSEALARSSAKWAVASGLALDAALIVRSQLIAVMLIVLTAVLAAMAPRLFKKPAERRLALVFALSLLPLVPLWAGLRVAVGDRDDINRLGFVTYRQPYPVGFWQHLESDGWVGPYRFKKEPYYQALVEESRSDPQLMRSRLRQYLFTARYVARRPIDFGLLALDNAYRLYDRPANDFKWDYTLSYGHQIVLQRALCLLALSGLALFAAERLSALGVFLLPLMLLALHAVTYPFPRYNLPAMPIIIAAAGAFLFRAVTRKTLIAFARSCAARWAFGGGSLLVAVGLAATSGEPEWSRLARIIGSLALLALPFIAVTRIVGTSRSVALSAAAYGLLAILFLGHASRDRLWHQKSIIVGGENAGMEQEITLSDAGLSALRSARQAFIMFDVVIPRGERDDVTVAVGGRVYEGARLQPTMPPFRESFYAGGRDWRGFAQWWALPLETDALPANSAAPLRIALRVGAQARLNLETDRFRDQERYYEGPSFGDWPYIAALKLDYDADYRIPTRVPLESAATHAAMIDRKGRRNSLRSVPRIRVIIVGNSEGSIDWESAPVPRSPAALGFFAFSEGRASAELDIDGKSGPRFPLGLSEDASIESGPYRLCHRACPPKGDKTYGGYVLTGPFAANGRTVRFGLRFLAGLSHATAYFTIDRKPAAESQARLFDRCDVKPGVARLDGAQSIINANRNNYPEDTGWWRAARVY